MCGAARERILVVDDDADVRAVVAAALTGAGFTVDEAASAMEAFAALDREVPNALVLDVVMPSISGLEVLDHVRRNHPSIPVLLLSSLGADENIVRGLRLGADDYIVKPVSLRVLVARVQRSLRSGAVRAGASANILHHGDLEIDLEAREARLAGELVELTAREFDLLAFFVRNPGRVYTRRQLLTEVWHSSPEWQQVATVTEHIRRLRRKIEGDRSAPRRLLTVRNVGYRFARETEPAVPAV